MNLLKKSCLIISTFVLSTGSAFAVQLPGSLRAHNDYGMPSLLNLVVSMFVVIGLIYATGWVYTKLNVLNKNKLGKLGAKSDEKNKFSILQSMPLGQQRHIYSIEMNGKVLLVGATPSHISLIKEFDSKDENKCSCDCIEIPYLNIEELNKESMSQKTQTQNKDTVFGNSNLKDLYEKYRD